MNQSQEEIEKILVSIWQEQLLLQEVSLEDSFVDLGGDSLKAMKIVTRIEKYCQIKIKVSVLFGLRSIKNIAKYIASKHLAKEQHSSESDELSCVSNIVDVPVTADWLAEKFKYQRYIGPHVLFISNIAMLELKELEKNITRQLMKYKTFQISFNQSLSANKIIYSNNVPFEFIISNEIVGDYNHDVKLLEEMRKKDVILIFQFISKNNSRDLAIIADPAILDKESLLQVAQLINSDKNPGTLSAQKCMVDFIDSFSGLFSNSARMKSIKYWKDFYSNRSQPIKNNLEKNYEKYSLKYKLDEKIIAIKKSLGTSDYIIYGSAFVVTLYRYFFKSDITFWQSFSSRNFLEFEDAIGNFQNLIPINLKLSRNDTYHDVFHILMKQSLHALENQHEFFPYLHLTKTQFNEKILFNFTNKKSELIKNLIESVPECLLFFDLCYQDDDQSINLDITFNNSLISPESIKIISQHFLRIINEIIENEDAKINEFYFSDPEVELSLFMIKTIANINLFSIAGETYINISTNKLSMENSPYWKKLFDDTYTDSASIYSGWVSSYSNNIISTTEMLEWEKNTTQRILSLTPKSVIDVGCGTGIIARNLLDHIDNYVGVEISDQAIERFKNNVAVNQLSKVNFIQSDAIHYSDKLKRKYDTIILNSVIQYFDDTEYLVTTLKNCINSLEKKGKIFIGDIRNLAWFDYFAKSILDSSQKSDVNEFEQMINIIKNDSELQLHPRFFQYLSTVFPEIDGVDILIKKGIYDNEMNKFRYDVILHIGNMPNKILTEIICSPNSLEQLAEILSKKLKENSEIALIFTDINNSNLKLNENTITIEKILKLADSLNLKTAMFWPKSGKRTCYDILFTNQSDFVYFGYNTPPTTDRKIPLDIFSNKVLEKNINSEYINFYLENFDIKNRTIKHINMQPFMSCDISGDVHVTT